MSKEILALKYRPKKFSDLVGQDTATRILTNSIKSGDLHHTYIFSGNLGSGKTSASRIFAACLNNPKGITLDPDMNDPFVQSIFEGNCSDVKEIDAASQRGIDDIRALKESIAYAPMYGRYKIVILDEAHKLTGSAVEACLKMMEEPPSGVIFILATTEESKIKNTILSRSMRIKFGKIAWNVIFEHLRKVSVNENIQVEDAALKICARSSEQSMRNALQNLQMLITFAGGKPITKEMAEQALASIDESHYFNLIDAILKPDAGDAMRVIDNLLGDGRNVGEVLSGLVDHLRILLVMRTVPNTSGLVYLTELEKKRYEIQKAKLHLNLIIRMVELIGDVQKSIAVNINPQTALEIFTLKSIIENASLKSSLRDNNGEKQKESST